LTGASTWILARFGRFQLYKVKIKWNSYECLLREGKKEEGGKTLVEKLTWLDSGIFRKSMWRSRLTVQYCGSNVV
jgi:hypothetical protein